MNEWKTYKLGEVLQIKYGKDHKHISEGDIPIYGSGGIMRYGNQSISQGPTIMIPRKGSLNNIMFSETPFWTVDTMFWSIIDTSIVNPLFLYYAICKKDFASLNVGSAVPSLTVPIIEDIEVSLPSLSIQNKIVEILKSLDDKIGNNRRINDNLEQQAQALFDKLISEHEFETMQISDIPHIIETGRRPKGGVANITTGVPSIGAENIKGLGYYDYSKTKYIPEDFADNLKKGFIKGYELLIYKDGGKPGYFIPNFSIFGEGFPFERMALNEHVFLLDFHNKGYNFFVYFYLQTEAIMKYLNAQGSKAAIPGIIRGDIESINLPTLGNESIINFCKVVEPIITTILNNAKESTRLATLRDTLLPKLMSGELSVDDVLVD